MLLTILESHEYSDEKTGLRFGLYRKHMYIDYQNVGLLFDVTRTDGLNFQEKTLHVKFHNAGSTQTH